MKHLTRGLMALAVFGLWPLGSVFASAADGQVSFGSSAYVMPALDQTDETLDPARRQGRIKQFKHLFALTLSDRTYENWPGKKMTDCVYPLMGLRGDGAWRPTWTERCRAVVGESQAYFYFSFNPYLHTDTIQEIEILVPGNGWPMKKEMLSTVDHVLGKSVAVLPKAHGITNSRPVWRWHAGSSKAILVEEFVGVSKRPVLRFVWVRPPQAPPLRVAEIQPASTIAKSRSESPFQPFSRLTTLASLLWSPS